MQLIAMMQSRLRLGLLAILLATTFVTTCFAGPIGVYIALAAALASLFFCFDAPMLARALSDWGVRCFLASFFILWAAFALSAQNGDDVMAFVDFLAFPVLIPIYALLARYAGQRNVVIVATLAALGCVVALAVGLYEVRVLGVERAMGNTSPIFFSNMSVLLGFFALWGLVTVQSKWRWLFAVAFAFAMGGAVLGGTRGSMLAAAALSAAFGAYVLFFWKRTIQEKLITLAVVGLGTLGFLFAFFDMTRMLSIAGTASELATEGVAVDMSANYRIMFYTAGLQSFMESPIFGNGWWRRFAAAIPYMDVVGVQRMAHDNHAHLHNDTINFASAAGVMGIFAYFLLMAAPVVSALRSVRDDRWSLRVFIALGLAGGYVAMGLTDTMFVFEVPKSIYVLASGVVMAFFLSAPPVAKRA